MANNNAIYTYSNNGMFRNNKVFRPDAMRCRDLKGYNPTFYEKLQAELAPVNKDDDYGTYDEKWRKWTTLRDRLQNHFMYTQADTPRFITSRGDLPSSIETIIDQAEVQLRALVPNVILKLDGDWVNGTWIDNSMLNFYRENSNNTHDDIVLFIKLREYLHNRTGVSKLSIYITNADYTAAFDAVVENFKTQIDFYFGNPTGENAITL